jgi:hypothetical protein
MLEMRLRSARGEPALPQISGLCFTYDVSAPVGSRVLAAIRQAANGSCTGAPVDLTAARRTRLPKTIS